MQIENKQFLKNVESVKSPSVVLVQEKAIKLF
jgi:hypothetical protein